MHIGRTVFVGVVVSVLGALTAMAWWPATAGWQAPAELDVGSTRSAATLPVAGPLDVQTRLSVVGTSTLGGLGRLEALGHLPTGTIRLEVRNARTGAPVAEFRYRVYGPGTLPAQADIRGHSSDVLLRIGMPTNLRVESKGYEPIDLRQVCLTKGEDTRRIRVRLRPLQ